MGRRTNEMPMVCPRAVASDTWRIREGGSIGEVVAIIDEKIFIKL